MHLHLQSPRPVNLMWERIGRHDGFVDTLFGGEVAKGFVLANILASASGLVVGFGVVASGAGVPDGDVVATGETVVLVVEVFVGVGWRSAA